MSNNTLQTSTATILAANAIKWPTLKSASEAAAAIGIAEQRLLDLADAQIAPHWRIDGGPPPVHDGRVKGMGQGTTAQAV